MKKVIAIAVAAVAALVAVIAIAFVANVGPFKPSVSELVSKNLGTPAKCRVLGLTEMAGARTTVYSCAARMFGGDVVVCRAVIDDNVYTVSNEEYNGCAGL